MKWGDIFEDPALVGQTEYAAIHEAIAVAVMGTANPNPHQRISSGKQQHIAEMLEALGDQIRQLAEALSKIMPVKTYWRACACGKVLVVTERDNRRASGGKALEFAWKRGAYTASSCLVSFPCPECGQKIEWNDGSWQVLQGPLEDVPYIWLQPDESEGSAKCGCRLVGDLQGKGAAMFLCPMHAAAPALVNMLALEGQSLRASKGAKKKRGVNR